MATTQQQTTQQPTKKYAVNKIGVFSSGGDSPGMNATIRAVIRTCLLKGVECYGIYDGYQGMVDGVNNIQLMTWSHASGILQKGGTILGTARCKEFRTRDGRKKATKNLVSFGIDSLICIGGDGSLTGADILRQEWPSLLEELVKEGQITPELAAKHNKLSIVGTVGSIDNDMIGTDLTIGADTAMHRISNALDCIVTTASSHGRVFILEVMGRDCGFLSLMAAVQSGCDFLFIPEDPPAANWRDLLIAQIEKGKKSGKRAGLVIISEGAKDVDGKAISSNEVRQVLETALGIEARVTVLGHMQRGGSPSAYDRYMPSVVGVESVNCLLEGRDNVLVGIEGYRASTQPLMDMVKKTTGVSKLIAAKKFDEAIASRGSTFVELLDCMKVVLQETQPTSKPRYNVGIFNVGASAPGMNAAIRVLTRYGLGVGFSIKAIRNGFEGLRDGLIEDFNWYSVSGWSSFGGSNLGTNRTVPDAKNIGLIAENLKKHNIKALILVGGFEGYKGLQVLASFRDRYPSLQIPLIAVPATISNNTPGSDISIGADKALNNMMEATDNIKQSAIGYARRIFVVEVLGARCGYLAMMGGIVAGAEGVYTNEEGVTLNDLTHELDHIKKRFSKETSGSGSSLSLYITNESASSLYTTHFIASLFEKETNSDINVRTSVLGHLQQGGNPTPLDRILASRFAYHAINYLKKQPETTKSEDIPSIALGQRGAEIESTPLKDIFEKEMDMDARRPSNQWWMKPLRQLQDNLSYDQTMAKTN